MRIGLVCLANSIKANKPGQGASFTCCNPKKARVLFSSTIGTMSAAMAVATKSKYSKYDSAGILYFSANAEINLNTTPQPHNSLNG